MFRYEHPAFLWLLLALPVLLGLWWAYRRWRKKAWDSLGDPAILKEQITHPASIPPGWYLLLLLGALACMIIGLANPQWGQTNENAIQQRTDVWLALDVSQSMNTTDLAPSRLARAKRLATDLAKALRGERVGLIYFACNAYVEMPLSSDWRAAQLLLETASSDKAPTQGTALSGAIELVRASRPENEAPGLLVLLTDGEDHDDQSLASAQAAAAEGWRIYGVGIGTPQGGFIPAPSKTQSDAILLDENGKPYRSLLAEAGLRALSEAGQGGYFRLGDRDEHVVNGLLGQIERLQQNEEQVGQFFRPRSFFQLFLAIGLLLLLAEQLLPSLMKTRKE